MKIQLTSIEHAPISLPIWHSIMDDLANPPVHRVARVLGISRRSVYRYNQTGHAPRVAQLALFWLTSWGRATVHAQATNDAILACGVVSGLESEIKRLRGQVQHLAALDLGAANDPVGRLPHG